MKTIELGNDKNITLDIGNELLVKDLRKIYPLIRKYEDNEIEMVVQIVKAIAKDDNVEDILDSLNMEEMNKLSEAFGKIMKTVDEGKKK